MVTINHIMHKTIGSNPSPLVPTCTTDEDDVDTVVTATIMELSMAEWIVSIG